MTKERCGSPILVSPERLRKRHGPNRLGRYSARLVMHRRNKPRVFRSMVAAMSIRSGLSSSSPLRVDCRSRQTPRLGLSWLVSIVTFLFLMNSEPLLQCYALLVFPTRRTVPMLANSPPCSWPQAILVRSLRCVWQARLRFSPINSIHANPRPSMCRSRLFSVQQELVRRAARDSPIPRLRASHSLMGNPQLAPLIGLKRRWSRRRLDRDLNPVAVSQQRSSQASLRCWLCWVLRLDSSCCERQVIRSPITHR